MLHIDNNTTTVSLDADWLAPKDIIRPYIEMQRHWLWFLGVFCKLRGDISSGPIPTGDDTFYYELDNVQKITCLGFRNWWHIEIKKEKFEH